MVFESWRPEKTMIKCRLSYSLMLFLNRTLQVLFSCWAAAMPVAKPSFRNRNEAELNFAPLFEMSSAKRERAEKKS